MFYGVMYSVVDTRAADDMLEFIRTNNPVYYQKLTNETDSSYLKDFYKNYTTHGNRKIILIGLFFIAISVNISVPTLYFVIREKMKEEKEKVEEEDGNEEEQEEQIPDGQDF